jgi:hypothetical protein
LHLIRDSIHETINTEFEKKYKILDSKLCRLANAQKKNVNHDVEFYPRVINNTTIDFTNEEVKLLNEGLKYNRGRKRKYWIRTLACEAESAITLLPPGEQERIWYTVVQNIKKLQYQQYRQQIYNSVKNKEELWISE